ncbi:glycosyltransferase [Granulicella sp. dw_53]|uniref:glycosyltransferase n=1 Tax=Granulicella sp. dw_53 TaxID=2719792 RepID=UPI001BD49B27|nr:glycosyltransferase [Granulicella sp. dw_53]
MTQSKRSNATPRIAFMGDPLAGWGGGIDFLRLCISALNSVLPGTIWQVLLPGQKTLWQSMRARAAPMKRLFKILLGRNTHHGRTVSREDLMRAMRSSGASIDIVNYRNNTSGLARAMRQCNAEVLFFCDKSLGTYFPLPWVGYIADLQHKRLPHWFTEKERRWRDKRFTRILTDATVVVVNAKAVIQDIKEFYPGYKARLIALPFCPPAKLEFFSDTKDPDIRVAYKLPHQYFLISNQFTVHKDHGTAFVALRLVRDAGYDVHIVCTGDMYDYRWPKHSDNLQALIDKNEMTPYIGFLGFLAKDDQLAIMRGSVAVLQPTLFEGGPGGGAVYDAVSTGTPSIVSDIPVNREIDIGTVRFFEAGSAEDLAEKMIDILANPPKLPSMKDTFVKLIERQQELGNLLLDISNMSSKNRRSGKDV